VDQGSIDLSDLDVTMQCLEGGTSVTPDSINSESMLSIDIYWEVVPVLAHLMEERLDIYQAVTSKETLT
jgi:hypothetical protein